MHARLLLVMAPGVAALTSGCVAPLGPGYTIEKRRFELTDLIAAFEQETHQNTAEFVRIWMKRPGVPEEFRSRYQEPAAATAQSEKCRSN